MIDCPHCGGSNREGGKFCGQCGRPLGAIDEVTCPMCDARNPAESTACSQCGARLVPLTALPAEEPPEPLEAEAAVAEELEGGAVTGEEEAVAAEELEAERVGAEVEELEGEPVTDEAEEVSARERAEEAPPPSAAESAEGIPPWLEKLRELAPDEAPVGTAEAAQLPRGELPEWLEIPPEFEDMLSEVARPVEEEIAPAEIPDWLDALRPSDEEGVIAPGQLSETAESKGLLRGIKGVLRIEPVLALPRRATPRAAISPADLADERGETFARVAAEPARAKVEVGEPSRVEGLLARSVRWLIYLIVTVAVVVPVLLGSNWAAAKMRASEPTIAIYDTIEALPQNAVVLVSHDYDPGVAAEMVPQAQAVLHHLMERGVRLINVSMVPEGVILSRRVVDGAAQEHGYTYGQDYVNLGYILGVEVGARSLAGGFLGSGWTDSVEHRHFSEFPVASGVGALEDIDLIVALAGRTESLRLWLEQVQSPYRVPMVAGVSATVDPFARPYYHNQARRQLLGLMSGLVGAAEYEHHSGRAGSALPSMDAQSLVHMAIVLLVVLGNGAYFLTRLSKG